MAITNYGISPVLGVDLNNVFTPSATTGASDGYDNPPHGAGDLVFGNDGSEWEYVKAATTINQYDCVAIDNAGNASQITKALADTYSYMIGFAQIAIASGSYGWVCRRGGNIQVNVLTGTSANAPLYTTATAGALSSTSTSQDLITGVVVTTANSSGSTTNEPAIASWPRILQ